MRINRKLMAGFLVVTFLVSIVGFFSISSFKSIQKNNELEKAITEHVNVINELQSNVLDLIETTNLSEFNRSLMTIEDLKQTFNLLHNRSGKITHEYELFKIFYLNIEDFNNISDEIIAIHREKLIQKDIFDKKYNLEKEQRYKIRDPLFALNNSKLTEDIGFMQYYSKETLYQHKDQKHMDEWLGSIQKIRAKIETLKLPWEQKNSLLKELDSYRETAQIMGQIAIRNKEIEIEEQIKLDKLRDITGKLEDTKKTVVDSIQLENKELALRSSNLLVSVILVVLAISIGLGYTITNLISKPLTRLRDATIEVGKGNLNTQIEIESDDEVGQLASAFKKMTTDLQRTTVSKDYVDNIIKSMFGTLVVATPEGIIKTVNKATCDLLEYKEEELIGQPIDVLFAKENVSSKWLEELIVRGFVNDVEKTYQAKKGRKIPMLLSGSVMRNSSGDIQGIVLVALDITEQKWTMEALGNLSSAVKQTDDSIIITNKDGIIEYVNPAFEKLTGYTGEEVIGKTPRILKSGMHDKKFYEKLYETVLSGGAFRAEFINMKKNGEIFHVAKTITPIIDVQGNITHFVSTEKDITEQKKAEEIRRENERLTLASKAKSEFLATMSHELRTPLNSIIGFTELLRQKVHGDLNEKQGHYLDNILTGGKNLLRLINDILDISRVEAGKMEIIIDKISVPEAIDETLALIKEKAAKNNVILKKELDPELGFIEADKQRFKQILFNLLSNAVKFSKGEGGTVTIASKREGDMARFSISDTGIGIKEEDMCKLFKTFEQLDMGISRSYGGTGLGLAISKKLVELHGGKILAESRYGEGSTFIFLLPITVEEGLSMTQCLTKPIDSLQQQT